MAKYRSDIEGLRAIAVSSITLFHFGYAGLGGGYVGVDVFFVISGFLIGRSVIAETLDGRFSLTAFFERRIRRLYPALVVAMLACAAVAPLLLLPFDLALFGKSMVATAGYASNILFLKEAGYFDSSAIQKPLLHTWSLAVEEQFYIAFPLLLMLLARARASRRTVLAVVALIAAASLLGAQAAMARVPSAAFFLFPLRAWELLAGVLVGAADWRALAARRRLRQLVAGAGLLLIVAAILLYRPATPFPGIGAIPPVLGTAMVIAAGSAGGSAAAALLGWRPLGLIGLVSYSLYLWHWPLAVGLVYYHGGEPLPQAWRLGGLAATALLAALSYRLVEEPFRRRRGSRWRLFAATAAVSLLLIAVGLLFYRSAGLPGRYDAGQRVLADAANDFLQTRGVCVDEGNATIPGIAHCRLGDPAAAPDFLVWGDSHGRAFRDAIDRAAAEHGRAGLLVWAGGCPPLMGLRKVESAVSPADDAACFRQSARLAAWLARDRALRDVLLIGRWAYYTDGGGLGADAANRMRLVGPPGAGQAALFARALDRTVATLAAERRRVFLLEQVPEVPWFSARALAERVLARHQPLRAVLAEIGQVDRADVERRQAVAERAFAALAARGRATVLPTHGRLCDATRCSAWDRDRPLLFDNNHVTVTGSLRLRGVLAPFLRSP